MRCITNYVFFKAVSKQYRDTFRIVTIVVGILFNYNINNLYFSSQPSNIAYKYMFLVGEVHISTLCLYVLGKGQELLRSWQM